MILSAYDRTHVYEILTGHGDWFGAQLLRLIAKADTENRGRLAMAFPEAVQAYLDWDRKTGSYADKHDGETRQ